MRRARPLLGTIVDIRIPHDGAVAESAVEAAFAAIGRVHRLMSAHDPLSDVSRINRSAPGYWIDVDPWTYAVLSRAKDVQEATEGLFDCAVARVLVESGYLPGLGQEVPEHGLGGPDDIELRSGCSLRLRRRLRITLDGIAKGFAVDQAVDVLRSSGVAAGVVNAGGDLRVFGEGFEPIHIRHPASPGKLLAIGHVKDAAVASSSACFSRVRFRGHCMSPIVDPQTMMLCNPEIGVTVVAGDCTTADALTKPLLIDPERARPMVARLGARAILVDSSGAIR
jgi:thiamine biosynthesis lipoprotein